MEGRRATEAIKRAVARAGLPPGLSCHGLRKLFVANLAEAGCTDAEFGGLVPHSARMTAFYANQRVLAAAGMAKLVNAGRG
jgi:hypothetical protein